MSVVCFAAVIAILDWVKVYTAGNVCMDSKSNWCFPVNETLSVWWVQVFELQLYLLVKLILFENERSCRHTLIFYVYSEAEFKNKL